MLFQHSVFVQINMKVSPLILSKNTGNHSQVARSGTACLHWQSPHLRVVFLLKTLHEVNEFPVNVKAKN